MRQTHYINWKIGLGVDPYTIGISVNSRKNDILATSYDINYQIAITSCSSNITCQLSKSTGIIYTSNNIDSFNVVITPNTLLNSGDSVFVEITAKTLEPYEKIIKATFRLVVAYQEFAYEISDSTQSPYLTLNMTNTHPVPNTVKLTFDPSYVVLDMTSSANINFLTTTYINKGSFNYINSVSFLMGALSSESIRFYKIDDTANYTYPIVNPTSIVTVQIL